jgi:hypothetical protein
MGAILHWESCRQNNIINSIVIRIVIHCTIRLNVCHNKLFLPNLWKCQYHVYWNLSYPFCILKVIFSKSHNFDQRNKGRLYTSLEEIKKKMARSTGVRKPPKLLLPNKLLMYLFSFLWNEILVLIFYISFICKGLAIQFVEMHCTRTHTIKFFYILISIRVTIEFYL